MESSDASYFQARDNDDAFVDQQTANTRTKSLTVVRHVAQRVTGSHAPQQGEDHKAYKPNGVPNEFGMCTRQIRLGQLSTLRDNKSNNSNHEGSHHLVSHYSCLSARSLAS